MSRSLSTYITVGRHEIHVTQWGSPGRPALMMWHGLARTGRDFDELAQALSESWFVLCPDTLGRGLSSWAADATTDYSYAAYGTHAAGILSHYGIDRLSWIGTSMGGLLGVTLAAGMMKGRIDRLVVNDIGPAIPEAASSRIAAYVGNPPVFPHVSAMETWFRQAYAPFGQNSDVFWRRMTDTSTRRRDDGQVTVHYDPRIVNQFTLHRADLDCWPAWDAVTCPTLLLRGADSDVLPRSVAQEMGGRGPRPRLVEFEEVGHAPTLTSQAEIALLQEFLA